MLPAMVLAAGLGTRLRPLTDERPKPLLPVGDRTVFVHAVEALRRAGVERVVANAHHLSDAVRTAAEPLGVAVSVEAELLGTAGGVVRARELIGAGPLIVWNGDVVAPIDVGALVQAHAERPAEATLVAMPRPVGDGNVGVDDGGRVVRLRRETFGREAWSGDFACVHVLGDDLRKAAPERGCLVGDVYLPALRRGATLRAVAYDGPWHDIGSVASYLAANLAWLEARGAQSWVGPGVSVADAVRLEQTVLGEGAVVRGAGGVARSVAWPGAHLQAPAEGVVVTPRRIVQVDGATPRGSGSPRV